MGILSDISSAIAEPLTGVTPEEVEWAYSMGRKYGGVGSAGGEGNKGDAARHISLGYLAALADERRGYADGWSQNLAQLKEYGQQAFRRRNIDSNMDRYNNAIGFELQGMAGDSFEDFESLLDDAMQNTIQVKSVDDMAGKDFRSLKPVYIKEGYLLYKGGGKAGPNK
tara:strand:+ start:5209 stop:5712 length:504 start_codon:yes stop_codon:yes gene_type:complete